MLARNTRKQDLHLYLLGTGNNNMHSVVGVLQATFRSPPGSGAIALIQQNGS